MDDITNYDLLTELHKTLKQLRPQYNYTIHRGTQENPNYPHINLKYPTTRYLPIVNAYREIERSFHLSILGHSTNTPAIYLYVPRPAKGLYNEHQYLHHWTLADPHTSPQAITERIQQDLATLSQNHTTR